MRRDDVIARIVERGGRKIFDNHIVAEFAFKQKPRRGEVLDCLNVGPCYLVVAYGHPDMWEYINIDSMNSEKLDKTIDYITKL